MWEGVGRRGRRGLLGEEGEAGGAHLWEREEGVMKMAMKIFLLFSKFL